MLCLDPGGQTGRGECSGDRTPESGLPTNQWDMPRAAKPPRRHVLALSLRTSPDGRGLGGPTKPPLPAGLPSPVPGPLPSMDKAPTGA